MTEETQEEIMNVANEVLRVAAPIQHSHNNATESVNGYMSAEDKKKLNGIAEGANKTDIIIDSALEDDTKSTNPVQAKVIMAKLKEIKDTIITASSTLNPSSTTQVVSAKGIATYIADKIKESKVGSAESPFTITDISSLDNITENGVYYIEQNPAKITCGNDTIDIYQGYIEVKDTTVENTTYIQTQNVITTDGTEYSRWKSNNSTTWSNWRIYYMPRKQYTKSISIQDDVYNLEIWEDTKGYTIIWNQSLSKDKKYFITSTTANEWKTIALFPSALQIEGCFIFGNNSGNFDIMITGGHNDGGYGKYFNSGIYIRSTNGSERIKGINYTFFVPRNN